MVGLIPLLRGRDARAGDARAARTASARRMEWFLENRPDLTAQRRVDARARQGRSGGCCRIVDRRPAAADPRRHARRARVPVALRRARAVARPQGAPVRASPRRQRLTSSTTSPAESTNALFGGNSNWRGPVWFPVNYLLIEALQKFHYYFGDELHGGVPDRLGADDDAVGGGDGAVAAAVVDLPAARTAAAPSTARTNAFQHRPALARPGALPRVLPRRHRPGLGASHQTGWTAVVAKLLQQSGDGTASDAAMRSAAWLVLALCCCAAPAAGHAAPRPTSSTSRRRRRSSTRCCKLAQVTDKDVVYDLGCGDGRIPITAAQKYGARGVGIDIDPKRIEEANENAKAAGVTDKVKFLNQDLFESDIQRGDGRHALPAAVAQREADAEAEEGAQAGLADRLARASAWADSWPPDERGESRREDATTLGDQVIGSRFGSRCGMSDEGLRSGFARRPSSCAAPGSPRASRRRARRRSASACSSSS